MSGTVFVRCDDGSVMEHDLPLPSGIADRVERGHLRLVNADGSAIEAEPAAPADSDTVPDGSIAVVLGWVGEDKDRAREALKVESRAEKPRVTLVNTLTALVEAE